METIFCNSKCRGVSSLSFFSIFSGKKSMTSIVIEHVTRHSTADMKQVQYNTVSLLNLHYVALVI